MNLLLRSSAVLAAAIALTRPDPSLAQQHPNMPGMSASETAAAAAFRPGLGDLMTAFVQPRHIKLGLAGTGQNWPYAAYELHELAGAFDKIVKLVPKHGNLAVPEAIAATVKSPIAALDLAIKAGDTNAFTTAYAGLTASCNACHQSADHAMIVIQVPAASPFPDQDFRAPQK